MGRRRKGNFGIIIMLIVVTFFLARHSGLIGLMAVDVPSTPVYVDFGSAVGVAVTSYGGNENDAWLAFSQDYASVIQNLHKTLDTEYIRAMIGCQGYLNPNTFPFDGTSYDFNNLDIFVDAILLSDAIPFITFTNGIESCGGEAHHNPPPSSDEEFADYVANVVQHFRDRCVNNQYSVPCNVNEWYFEVWNEPGEDWWQTTPSRYSQLFNAVHQRIESIAPGAKVGGFGGGYVPGFPYENAPVEEFLSNCNPDFVSLHHYGNMMGASTRDEKMAHLQQLMYDGPAGLKQFSGVEINMGEYLEDSRMEYGPDEPFGSAWVAAALMLQLKAGVDTENFFPSTSIEDNGFGFWGPTGITTLEYDIRRSFVTYNPKGSTIYDDGSLDDFELLAVENANGKFVSVVNKRDASLVLDLEVVNSGGDRLVDLDSGEEYVIASVVSMGFEPYETKFLQVQSAGGCVENWQCDAWSSCVGGVQTRTCTDLNSCGTTDDKPAESQSCTSGGQKVIFRTNVTSWDYPHLTWIAVDCDGDGNLEGFGSSGQLTRDCCDESADTVLVYTPEGFPVFRIYSYCDKVYVDTNPTDSSSELYKTDDVWGVSQHAILDSCPVEPYTGSGQEVYTEEACDGGCVPSCVRPTDLCLASSSDGCGGICSWTVTQNTLADVDCNNFVVWDEFTTFAQSWLNGMSSWDDFINVARAWLS